jgi:hypothetical protein
MWALREETFRETASLTSSVEACYQHINSAKQVQEFQERPIPRRMPIHLTHSFVFTMERDKYVA